jgi:hypothetical protein
MVVLKLFFKKPALLTARYTRGSGSAEFPVAVIQSYRLLLSFCTTLATFSTA